MANNVDLATALEPQVLDALTYYHLPEPLGVRLLTFSENAVYRVDFSDHPPVVVRLHSLGYHKRPAIESELDWIEALRVDTAVVTARVVRTSRHQRVVVARQSHLPPRLAVLFECLDGKEPSGDSLRTDFGVLGRTTAHMHNHARNWSRPADFYRFRWDLDGTLGGSPHWGTWQANQAVEPGGAVVLDRAAKLIASRLNAYGQSPAQFGLIHADLRLTNLMVRGSTVQVIDFDDCGFGWFLYDLGSALTFMEDDPRVPDLVDAWLAGYREVRALTLEDEAEIPTFLMLRRLVILAWLGSRPNTELVQALGTDYARASVELAETFLSTTGGPGPEGA